MRKSVLMVMGLLSMLSAIAAEEKVALREVESKGFAGGVPVEVEASLLRTGREFGKLEFLIGNHKLVMPRNVLDTLDYCDIGSLQLTFSEVGKTLFVTAHFCGETHCVAVRVDGATGNVEVSSMKKDAAPQATSLLEITVPIHEN